VIQHDDDGPPALLDEWARRRGVQMTVFHMRRSPKLPDPAAFEFAIVLGSVAHVGDRAEAWVADEIAWLRSADDQSLPVLGICFGAQVLAAALGGAVRAAPRPEIGWISVSSDAPDLIGPGPWYSWHSDVIELPPAASELARNEFCPQAYAIGPHLAVQFHPEVTAALAGAWAAAPGAAEELGRARVDAGAFARESERMAPLARDGAIRLFDGFLAQADPDTGRERAVSTHR